jgi:hypothetical protein
MEDTRMSPLRFFPILAGAVSILAVLACADPPSGPSDDPSSTYVPPSTYVPRGSFVTLNGIVHTAGNVASGVVLQTDGDEIRLAGSETARLKRVEGAEVEVRGMWNMVDALTVNDFLVRAVNGVAALDGVLIMMWGDGPESEFLGYGVRLTRGARIVPLVDPPQGLIEHAGKRVWVTGALGGPPMAYGVIGRVVEPY